jgi:hypothetical protein
MNKLFSIAALALVVAASAYADDWQKMKDCAAQADKWEKRYDVPVSQKHFSPKYGHCYMEVYHSDHGVLSRNLIDPFEDKTIAGTLVMQMDDKTPPRLLGFIEGERLDFDDQFHAAQAFIEDHMNH